MWAGWESAASTGLPLVYIEFAAELADIDRLVEADERVLAFDAELAECMQTAGLEYSGLDELQSRFLEKVADLIELERVAGAGSPELIDALRVTQAEERQAARAVTSCGLNLVELDHVSATVLSELEIEFIDANQERLDTILAES